MLHFLFATYFKYADKGVEMGVQLEGMSEAQISKVLEDLVKAGAGLKA